MAVADGIGVAVPVGVGVAVPVGVGVAEGNGVGVACGCGDGGVTAQFALHYLLLRIVGSALDGPAHASITSVSPAAGTAPNSSGLWCLAWAGWSQGHRGATDPVVARHMCGT